MHTSYMVSESMLIFCYIFRVLTVLEPFPALTVTLFITCCGYNLETTCILSIQVLYSWYPISILSIFFLFINCCGFFRGTCKTQMLFLEHTCRLFQTWNCPSMVAQSFWLDLYVLNSCYQFITSVAKFIHWIGVLSGSGVFTFFDDWNLHKVKKSPTFLMLPTPFPICCRSHNATREHQAQLSYKLIENARSAPRQWKHTVSSLQNCALLLCIAVCACHAGLVSLHLRLYAACWCEVCNAAVLGQIVFLHGLNSARYTVPLRHLQNWDIFCFMD